MIKRKDSGISILFIDDEDLLLQCWVCLFEKNGCIVSTATNKADATELFTREQKHIDIVIIDFSLDDCNGFEVYHELKSIKPDIRVIFTSAAPDLPDWMRLPYGEKPPFIQKPFYYEELLERIDALYSLDFIGAGREKHQAV